MCRINYFSYLFWVSPFPSILILVYSHCSRLCSTGFDSAPKQPISLCVERMLSLLHSSLTTPLASLYKLREAMGYHEQSFPYLFFLFFFLLTHSSRFKFFFFFLRFLCMGREEHRWNKLCRNITSVIIQFVQYYSWENIFSRKTIAV